MKVKSPIAFMPLPAIMTLVAVLLCSCQAHSAGGSSGNSSDLALKFKVMQLPSLESVPGASSAPSKSVSKLIMSTAKYMTVILEPMDSGNSLPIAQTVDIPSTSGEPVVTVTFSDVAWGKYTVSAVASDAGGNAQFGENSVIDVSGSTQAVSLTLTPVGTFTSVTSMPFSINLSMAANAVQMFTIPANLLSVVSNPPVGYYNIRIPTTPSELIFMASDQDGNILFYGEWMSGVLITLMGGTSTVNSSSGQADIDIGPCPSSGPTTLMIVNGSSANSGNATLSNNNT
jgi:hypothetical protein